MRRLHRCAPTVLSLSWLACLLASPAFAAFPERPIVIVVPFAAGGGSDSMTRAIARRMATDTGYSFVVENRPGAGGNIAAVAVAKSKPDGYTLVLASPGTHGINTYLYRNAGFDPIADFTPIGLMGNSAMVMFAHASLPASNLKELLELVKKQPGKYAYGSPGAGTQHHLGVEQLKLKAGLDMPHVPYKGAGPAMTDLVAGHIPLMIGGFGPAASYVAQGRIKVIAAANSKRLSSASDVPLFGETVPGVGVGSWVGLAAPAGTPADAVRILSEALAKALGNEELKQSMQKLGVDLEYQPPAVFGRMIAAELSVWKEAVEASGAKAD
ncbi:MAG: tripartite tricarboxylate transporter substrate binding protein [Betaproteobacteria bacterium]|nr:tripartite tricarboxylate transporter substrate binding protein [Betaproteobacteria bacterium]